MAKNHIDRVVKPLKKALKLSEVDKKTGEEKPITEYTVVNQDGVIVKTFTLQDYGPRAWFKARQYASNYSSLSEVLTVKELD